MVEEGVEGGKEGLRGREGRRGGGREVGVEGGRWCWNEKQREIRASDQQSSNTTPVD